MFDPVLEVNREVSLREIHVPFREPLAVFGPYWEILAYRRKFRNFPKSGEQALADDKDNKCRSHQYREPAEKAKKPSGHERYNTGTRH